MWLGHGKLDNTDVSKGPFRENGNEIYIGTRPGGVVEHFEGLIDEVRMYNRALKAEEVSQLHESAE